jgi:hypothetical protein
MVGARRAYSFEGTYAPVMTERSIEDGLRDLAGQIVAGPDDVAE